MKFEREIEMETTAENQIVTAKKVGYNKKVSKTATGVTVKRIMEKNEKIIGTATFAGTTWAVVKVSENHWEII